MSFQFMPAAIFGLTLYVLAGIGLISLVGWFIYGAFRVLSQLS